ncbi:TAP-like family protein [Mycobacterium xenopi 3993]|nr:TAP-like family protein [Mycobacterium xenopi 3993]
MIYAHCGGSRRRRRRTGPSLRAGKGRRRLHHPRPRHPYRAGVELARQLRAPLITYDGTQHTAVFNGDKCVDAAVVRYLVDQVSPPNNFRC